MVQGQLDDSTEFGDLLELQEQIRALQTELAEVKQADDEELDKLLDQNGVQTTGSCCISTCWYQGTACSTLAQLHNAEWPSITCHMQPPSDAGVCCASTGCLMLYIVVKQHSAMHQ